MKLLLFLIPVFLLLLVPFANANTTNITANHDTWISGYIPWRDTNWDNTELFVYLSPAENQRPILGFDVSSIPANSTINSVTLHMYSYDDVIGGGGSPQNESYYVVPLVRDNWVETEATWNIYKTGSSWTVPGGDWASDKWYSPPTYIVNDDFGWHIWNITGVYMYEYGNSTLNLLMTHGGSVYQNGIWFYDSESAYYAPYITVDYIPPSSPSVPSINISLSGLDCGNMWISSDPTVLGVTVSLTNVNSSVTKIAVKFNDTLNIVEAEYNVSDNEWSLLQGENIISMTPGIYTRTNSSSTNYTYTTIFKFIGLEPIQDAKYRQVYVNYTYSNGSGASYSAKSELFTIYNLGGQTEWQSWGNAGLITGGDTFAIYAEGNETDLLGTSSWVQVNQTWVRLQHFHAQMSIKLNLNGYGGEGEDQLWQDYDHSDPTGCYGNPCEYYLDAYNWRLKYMISYYDEVNHMWVDGWYIMLSMQQGDISSTAEWTQINATMYNGPAHTKMDSQLFNAWIEREPEAKIRLWVDLWFNQANSSRVHASRANAMYFGIIGSGGWWVWTPNTWEPQYQNQSQSTSFEDLLDANSNVISSSQLKCMVVSETLFAENYVEHETLPFDSFTVRVADWDSLDFNLAPTKIMRGTGTPMFNTPLMPDLAPTGLLGAIASAIQGIGGFFVKALQSLFAAIWASLGQQFPWFTGSIESMYKLINALFIFFPMIMNGFSSILTLIGSQFWLFSVLGDSMNQVFAMISYWVYLFPPSTYNSLILLGVILVIILPFSDKLGRGDLKGIKQDLGDAWHIINVIMDYGLRLITTIVNWILRVLP